MSNRTKSRTKSVEVVDVVYDTHGNLIKTVLDIYVEGVPVYRAHRYARGETHTLPHPDHKEPDVPWRGLAFFYLLVYLFAENC